MKRTHYIYLGGLGDGYDGFRMLTTRLWAVRRKVTAQIVPMKWSSSETYMEKIARIELAINDAPADSELVLVGESAGGSVAWVTGLKHPRISRVVTICGKNLGAQNVNPRYYKNNPALRDAIEAADATLEAEIIPAGNIRTIYSKLDYLIEKQDTLLPNSEAVSVSWPGHLTSIALIGLFHFRAIQK